LERNCSGCGRHLISINFPHKNWEGYYAYSSRMGGKLCLLAQDKFCLVLYDRWSPWVGDIPKNPYFEYHHILWKKA
jgi:hypothetical protein